MKGSVITIIAIASLTAAQSSGLPSCVAPCLAAAISNVGCGISDIDCQCSSRAAIEATGLDCLVSACTALEDLVSATFAFGGLANCKATASARGSSSESRATLTSAGSTTSTSARDSSSKSKATFTSNGSTTSTSASSISPSASSTDPVVTHSNSSVPINSTSSNLSSSAKAGIGVGCAVFVLITIVFGILLIRRRRQATTTPPPTGSNDYGKAELSGEGTQKHISELAGSNIHERDSGAKNEPPVELAAD